MDNNVLTAVPLFLFMGYLVERAGIVAKLFFAIRLAAHRLPASMAVAALITCTLFSTATGIIGAVVLLLMSNINLVSSKERRYLLIIKTNRI